MKQEKIHIERFVAKSFLNKIFGEKLAESDFRETNHIKHEPDIIYKNIGIEIGALLSSENTLKDKFVNNFLEKLNNEISGKIDANLIVKLFFQIDKQSLTYKPIEKNAKYTNLTPFLTRIEVIRYKGYSFKEQVCIAQKGLHREEDFPIFTNTKKFNRFLNDLVKILSFTPNKEGDVRGYSIDLSEVLEEKHQVDMLGKYFNKSILDKLEKDKYKGKYEKQFLLLHNYNPLSNGRFTTDMHFYSHYKDYVLNKISNLIRENNSFEIYDNVYFLDFSISPNSQNFILTDFRTYEPKKLEKPLEINFHIGIDFSCERLTLDKNNFKKDE